MPKKKASKKATPAKKTDLVTVEKDGAKLDIHERAVEDHKRLGWTVTNELHDAS